MFATGAAGKTVNSSEDVDDRSSKGRNDEQQDHHRDGSKLILVLKGCSKKTISAPGIVDVVRFLKGRWFTARDSFAIPHLATHV